MKQKSLAVPFGILFVGFLISVATNVVTYNTNDELLRSNKILFDTNFDLINENARLRTELIKGQQ